MYGATADGNRRLLDEAAPIDASRATGQFSDWSASRGAAWWRGQGLSREEQDNWRLIDRQGPFRQASGHLRVRRLNRSRALYISDIFHTLVNSSLRTVVLVFSACYLGIILFFTFLFMIASGPCTLQLAGFKAAWAFSLETIMTIGYAFPGDQSYFDQCTVVVALVTAESILGVLCDALAVGLVYARFSRAQSRACTIVFSDFCVMRRIRGKLVLMFQVAEMRKHQLVEAHVRCYALARHACPDETRPLFYFSTNTMRLVQPDDELGGMLFMSLPSMIVHPVDAFSPLRPRGSGAFEHAQSAEAGGAAKPGQQLDEGEVRGVQSSAHDPSSAYEFPDVLQRDCDLANGNRERKSAPPPRPDPQEEEDAIRDYLEAHKVEIVAVVEGIDAVTSDTIQARHSYCPRDILWHHDFVPCTFEGASGEAVLDFSQFHRTVPLECGAEDQVPLYVINT
mmetsp:Transcript_22066/g.70468  ORF Transcript_22066/g.70468 Transcript_22066/m.70468 type:complete len:452 (+) Transcript_22066:412-1767(+)